MKSMKELFRKKTPAASSMPAIELEEDDLPHRSNNTSLWIAALAIVAAVALIIASMPTASKESVSVNSRIISGKMHTDTVSTVLSGAGPLAYAKAEKTSIPANVTVTAYHVHNGDVVKKGDVLASVDPVEVNSAIVELQGILNDLDSDLNREKLQHPGNLIESKTPGRVKIIYAEKDVAIADTMYEHGALMVMSLDGNMSFQLEAPVSVGQIVDVTMADGTVEDGRVFSCVEGLATILVPDDTAAVGEQVTVADKDGKPLGTGTLDIHSPLKITGLSGIVTDIHVRENMRVGAYAPLIRLKDTGDTLKYRTLLEKRGKLEERMEKLVNMTDGTVEAEYDGIVSAVDKDIDFIALEPARAHSLPTPGIALLRNIIPTGVHTVKRLAEPEPGSGGGSGGGSGTGGGEDDPPKPDEPFTGVIKVGPTGIIVVETKDGETIEHPYSFDKLNLTIDGQAVPMKEMLMPMLLPLLNGKTVTVDPNNPVISVDFALSDIPNKDIQSLIKLFRQMDKLSGLNFDFSGFGGMGGFYSPTTPSYESYSMDETDILTLIPQEQMTVTVPVDELDILTLEKGMDAIITLDALKNQVFTGTITHINPVGTNAGGNTKYDVEFTLPQTEQMLEGMSASVSVVTDVSEPVSLIPSAALVEQGGKTCVYTSYSEKDDSLGGLVEVETGISDGENVQILSGIDENTTFYYRYADALKYQFSPTAGN